VASIYKPSYTKTDPVTGRKVKRRTRHYIVEYREPGGIVRRVKGYPDKEATKQLARRLENRTAWQQEGMVDPEHLRRPLTIHLEDFRRHLEAKNNCPRHVAESVARVKAILDGCAFRYIGDMAPGRVEGWLADLRQDGRGIATSNGYLRAVKSFTAWLVRDHRTGQDVLKHLSRLNPDTDRRHERRSVATKEYHSLLETTRESTAAFRGLSGLDRFMLYTLAGYTGLRCGELASVTPASFGLDAEQPTVTVEAAYSKRRRKDTLPLHPDLAALFQEWIASKPKDIPLWPGTWKEKAAKMLRMDLAAARSAWIQEAKPDGRADREASSFLAYRDDAGRVFDFHACRGQFISELARRGVHPKTAQLLARHSSINLTMNTYTHLAMVDLANAVETLPAPPAAGPNTSADTMRATGTDGKLVGQLVGADRIRLHSTASARTGTRAEVESDGERKCLKNKPLDTRSHPEASTCIRVGEGTRTPDPQSHSLML